MTNIVLLTIDSIRYDYFTGANSHLSPTSITPNLDKWADEALQFPLAFSPGPSTGLTFPALLSGTYSSSFREKYGVSEKRKMIAEYMREAGYTTCSFNSNPYLTSAYKYDKGFDYFFDDFVFQGTKKVHTLFKKIHLRFRSLFKEPYWTVQSMNKSIISWLAKHDDRPFFLWAHYMDVHGPYISKKGFGFNARLKANMLWQKATRSPQTITEEEKQTLKDTYIEEIVAFDKNIKGLLDRIPDDSVVIITGDHGDFLGEKGEYAHRGLLYNKLLHVPLIVKMPNKNLKYSNVNFPVNTVDIVPTILDFIDIPPADIVDGVSFLPIIEGEQDISQRNIIGEAGSYHMSVINYPWKLIANYNEKRFELYNLIEDSEEEQNLVEKNPKVFETLNKVLEVHREKMNIRREGIGDDDNADLISQNEELIKRMRQLGYME